MKALKFAPKLAIDLGTEYTTVVTSYKSRMLREPSIVAWDPVAREVVASGTDIATMPEKERASIQVVHPIVEGVIHDKRLAVPMVRAFLSKALRSKRIGGETVVTVPGDATSMTRKTTREVVQEAGDLLAAIVPRPYVVGMGAGLPLERTRGSMIVDVGAGLCEATIFSYGGIVASRAKPLGGHAILDAISRYLREQYHLLIGSNQARILQQELASANPGPDDVMRHVVGRDIESGRRRSVPVTRHELFQAVSPTVSDMVRMVGETLAECPPEIVADIAESGVVLTGGSALLHRLDWRLSEDLGVCVYLASEPQLSIQRGFQRLLSERKEVTQRMMRPGPYLRS